MKNQFIIAEVAQGYCGDFNLAKILIKAAKHSLADAVKFQAVLADELATSSYIHYNLFKTLEMSLSKWNDLKRYSDKIGIELIIDIFGSKSLQIAKKLNLNSIKLHPTDLSNNSLIKKVSNSHIDNVFLGIGGSDLKAIESAINLLSGKNIYIIVGFQGYPTKFSDNELCRINFLQRNFSSLENICIGFADHEIGDSGVSAKEISAVAIGNGAQFLEKHLTLSPIVKLEDYESALGPDQFLDYSTTMKKCWRSQSKSKFTSQNYHLTKKEIHYSLQIQRVLVADKTIRKGHRISTQNTALKRSGESGDVFTVDCVLGKKAKRMITKGKPIRTQDIE